MSELESHFRARAASESQLQRHLKFLARTLPPVNLVSFVVVWWFAGDWRILALAALFVAHILLFLTRTETSTHRRVVAILPINVAIFFAAAVVAGNEAPGWLLFIPPLVPATLVLQRHRMPVTLAINGACLLANLLVKQPPSVVLSVAMAFAAFSIILLRLSGYLHLQALEIERERSLSDNLLDAVLPPSISARIKNGEERIAERYEEVSILFADIVGFTALAERLTPEELVAFLNDVFVRFDELVARHGLEKIKTIGDAYMVASGLGESRHDIHSLADFALDLLHTVDELNVDVGPELAMRIGMHTGPVVAGIVGRQRFVYDAWGDTVNVAARMESHGVPDAIQVTDAVRELLEDDYQLEPRGTIAVKHKGDMSVWLLRRRRASSR